MSRTPAGTANDHAVVEYEPQLVEAAVHHALENGAPGLPFAKTVRLRIENRRHLARYYALPQGEARETAFRGHFRKLFRALRLDQAVTGWLETFPQLATRLNYILVRAARDRSDEGAELWESREHRGRGIPSYLVIALRPAGLSNPEELRDRVLPALRRTAERAASSTAADGAVPPADAQSTAAHKTCCPLCHFPTTDWASPELLHEIASPVEADFPDWSPAKRCCTHCGERYQDLASPEMAPSPY